MTEIPRISVSRSGSFSITSRASLPNSSTIFRAVALPMCGSIPEPRYISISDSVSGIIRSNARTLNCSPYSRWLRHSPYAFIRSPSQRPGIHPVSVNSLPSDEMSHTVYPFVSFSYISPSTVPSISSTESPHCHMCFLPFKEVYGAAPRRISAKDMPAEYQKPSCSRTRPRCAACLSRAQTQPVRTR